MNLIKNFFYNMSYQVLLIIVPFIVSPYVSRTVGPEGIGIYSYTYAVTVIFGLFVNLGVLKYGNREITLCGEDREARSRVFAELMWIKILSSIVVISVFLCYVNWFGGSYRRAFFLQIFTLLSFTLDVSWVFWGMQQFRITTIVCSLVKLLSVVLIFAFVRNGSDTYVYVLVLTITNFLVPFILWFYLPRYINFHFSVRFLFNRHWKSMVLLFFPYLARHLYIFMDKIMLGNIVGIMEVGYYEIAQSVSNTMVCVLIALSDVVMPQITLYFSNEENKKIVQLFEIIFHAITFLGVGMMYGLIGVAGTFVPWFYGESFLPSVPMLQTIAPLIVLSGYTDIIRNVFLLPQCRDKEYIIALCTGTLVNFLVNAALIPEMQGMGAIIGTLVAETTVLIIQVWYIKSEIPLWIYGRKAVVYCVLGSAILLPCYWIGKLTNNLFLATILDILAGGTLYVVCVAFYLRFFEKKVYEKISKKIREMQQKD